MIPWSRWTVHELEEELNSTLSVRHMREGVEHTFRSYIKSEGFFWDFDDITLV